MSTDPSVVRRQVEVLNELGLHMRPALEFVKHAMKFRSEIRVYHNGKEINGKSILDLTMLAAEQGTRLDLEASGPDSGAAVDALAQLFLDRFHEEETTAAGGGGQSPGDRVGGGGLGERPEGSP